MPCLQAPGERAAVRQPAAQCAWCAKGMRQPPALRLDVAGGVVP
jgi:hypothetical protein